MLLMLPMLPMLPTHGAVLMMEDMPALVVRVEDVPPGGAVDGGGRWVLSNGGNQYHLMPARIYVHPGTSSGAGTH